MAQQSYVTTLTVTATTPAEAIPLTALGEFSGPFQLVIAAPSAVALVFDPTATEAGGTLIPGSSTTSWASGPLGVGDTPCLLATGGDVTCKVDLYRVL